MIHLNLKRTNPSIGNAAKEIKENGVDIIKNMSYIDRSYLKTLL